MEEGKLGEALTGVVRDFLGVSQHGGGGSKGMQAHATGAVRGAVKRDRCKKEGRLVRAIPCLEVLCLLVGRTRSTVYCRGCEG